ncbi:hypothetical protein B0O99DRAFT_515434 [Bisporella sp. PMI_857]|nr:hypothetical protein B0O99DRAFT_515434 [Bisporella sp. PMI_857]
MTSLRKGATFHSPSPERTVNSHFRVPSLPRRSQSDLDDVVDAHTRRIALTLGNIDRGLTAADDLSPTVRQAFRDDAEPVPRSFLDHTVGPAAYDSIMHGLTSDEPAANGKRVLRPRQNRRPARYADSGLGSSIISSEKQAAETDATSVSEEKSVVAASAITRSAAAHSSTLENLPRLSNRASNRIHEHILRPLLAKGSLKDFHPVVRDCPRRINEKEIVCLRDLEKTLIFMAPVSETRDNVALAIAHHFSRLKERTKSAALYLDFCLTSIRCIQATVEYLSDHEQTRPSDRPYSSGYFIDLVDQIRQYAQQVQAAKEKEEKGEQLDDMDPESTDEVKLHGGLTRNGRPAELVRVKKNGKAISIATGLPVDLDEDSKGAIQFKRSLSEEAEDDESILRSMARRKRSASATELAPKRCREPGCNKEFKRPCDLTKHEKTHSRPWKCPNESCKYHEYGWPTEKEMDRHINDKHSAAPPMYECKFAPCAYRSKRESNCKQHMEKAHGWEYVRSKNNGKNRENKSVNGGLPTPQTTNMATPSNSGSVIDTPGDDDFNLEPVYSGQPDFYTADNFTFPAYPANSDIDMMGTMHQQIQIDYSPISEMQHSASSNQSPYIENMEQEHLDEQFPEFQPSGVDFNLYDNSDDDLYSAMAQMPTHNPQIFQNMCAENYGTPVTPFSADPVPHISPVGHGNTMLYTPTSLQDEGFEDFLPNHSSKSRGGFQSDFTLFPGSSNATVTNSASHVSRFGEVNTGFNLNNANISFPAQATAKDLLDYFDATTRAATQGNSHNLNQNDMDWTNQDQYPGYYPQ